MSTFTLGPYSYPTWRHNYIPTVDEWEYWFSNKIDSDGKIVGTDISGASTGDAAYPTLASIIAEIKSLAGDNSDLLPLIEKAQQLSADGGTYYGLVTGSLSGDASQAQTGNSTYPTVGALATGVQNVITGKAQNGNLAGYVLNYSAASDAAYFTYATATGGLAGILLPSSTTVDKKIDGSAANGNYAGLTLNYSPSSLGAYFTYTAADGSTQGVLLAGQSVTNNKMDKQTGSAPAQLTATSATSDIATAVNALIDALQSAGLWGRE